jgi:pilus assembly protein Flp/PilA
MACRFDYGYLNFCQFLSMTKLFGRLNSLELGYQFVIWKMHMKTLLNRFARDVAGATAIEYGLLASFVGLAIVGASTTLSSSLSAKFDFISRAFGG